MERRTFLTMLGLAAGDLACGGYNRNTLQERTNLSPKGGPLSLETLEPWYGNLFQDVDNPEWCAENLTRPHDPRMNIEQMVVSVRQYDSNNNYGGRGTGVLAQGRGMDDWGVSVITAYHVVDNGGSFGIYSPVLNKEYPAHLARFDEARDVALLVVEQGGSRDLGRCLPNITPHLEIASTFERDPPFNAYVGSYDSLLQEVVISRAVVTEIQDGQIEMAHTDTLYGDSGSPVFSFRNDELRLLGILTHFGATTSGTDFSRSRATHAEYLNEMLDELFFDGLR